MSMADSDILPAACTWVFPTMGIMQYNKNATERAKEDIKGVMKALNDHLLAKTFLVGERISLADIAVCCTLLSLYKQVMAHLSGAPTRTSTDGSQRWSTSPTPRLSLERLFFAQRRRSSTPRSSQSSPARGTRRRRRSRRRNSSRRR